MKPEKVLFLDIDGVVITGRSLVLHGNKGKLSEPDEVTLALLRRVTEEGVKLVISSSWRLGGKDAKADLEKILGPLMDHLHEDWATPFLGDKVKRGKEIDAWLKRHPEVKDYAILDDDTDMLPTQRPHYYKSNDAEGIPKRTMQRLIEWAEQPAASIVPVPKVDGQGMTRSGGEVAEAKGLGRGRNR